MAKFNKSKNTKTTNNTVKKKGEALEWWLYLPLILAIGYVPMIVRTYVFNSPLLDEQIWYSAGYQVDFFLASKMIATVVCGGFALIFLLASLYKYPFRWRRKIYIPILIYAAFVFLSGVISPYRSLAFGGSYEVFETVPCILSYLVLTVLGIHFLSYDGIRGLRIVTLGSAPGLFFITIVGVFQYFGMDILKTNLAYNAIVSTDIQSQMPSINVAYNGGIIYSTLCNPNYLGTFFGVLIPVLAVLIFTSNKLWERIIYIALCALSIFNLFGSHSMAGLMTFGFTILFAIIFFGYKKSIKAGGVVTAVVATLMVVAMVVGFNVEPFKSKVMYELSLTTPEEEIVAINTGEDGVDFMYETWPDDNGNTKNGMVRFNFITSEEGLTLSAVDENGADLEPKFVPSEGEDTSDHYTLSVPGLSGDFRITQYMRLNDDNKGNLYVGITYKDSDTYKFYYRDEDEKYYFITSQYYVTDFNNVANARIFPRLFLGRGSIWNLTIPTLPSHILLGSGAGTYIMVYPQEDYLYSWPPGSHVLDVKPHSAYLQQWSDSGLIALIAYMVIFLWAIVRSIRVFLKHRRPISLISLGFGLSAIANMLVGIANDSMVVSGTLVWTLLGIGLGLSFYVEKEENKGN